MGGFICKFGGDGCRKHRDPTRDDHLRGWVSGVLTKTNQDYFARLLFIPSRDEL